MAGVSVFVIGQIFLKWIIEPIQDFRKVISEILFYLTNYHDTIHNAKIYEKSDALSVGKNLERLGASLLASQRLIPCYAMVHKILGLPNSEEIILASNRLSLISKRMFGEESDINYKLDIYRIDLCEALHIKDPIQGAMSRQELKDGIAEIRNKRST